MRLPTASPTLKPTLNPTRSPTHFPSFWPTQSSLAQLNASAALPASTKFVASTALPDVNFTGLSADPSRAAWFLTVEVASTGWPVDSAYLDLSAGGRQLLFALNRCNPGPSCNGSKVFPCLVNKPIDASLI